MPFEMKQPGDFADDHVLRLVAQVCADGLAMLIGVQERLNVHPAIDRREFFARRNASLDHEIGHGVRHANQGMAMAGRVPFAPPKEGPRASILVRMKRRAMHRMNDCPHTQRRRGQSAEEARLGAMRVYHVWPELAKNPLQREIACRVAPWVDRPPQAGHEMGWHVASPPLL